MVRLRGLAALASALACAAEAAAVTPLEKVLGLLTGLRDEVAAEGKAEAKTYDQFACFCKDKTLGLSDSIKANRDSIGELSASLGEKTALQAEKSTELGDAKAKKEQLSTDLQKTEVDCAKERSVYEAEHADLSKAVSSLEGAIRAIETSKGPAALLAGKQVVRKTYALADAMAILDEGPQWAHAKSLLQQGSSVDPSDPEYKHHSQDLIDILTGLFKEFGEKKNVLTTEWAKTKETCEETVADLGSDLKLTDESISALGTDIERLGKEIGTARESLVTVDSQLSDNQLFLKDLTEMCEQRAADWDQRSAQRVQELGALGKALEILQGKAASAADDVNARALLLQRSARRTAEVSLHLPVAAASFLQEGLRSEFRSALSSEEAARRSRVVASLQEASARIGSASLSALASRLSGASAADPFVKVKDLIQKLVERLLQEATDEATKKGFCDSQVAKAETDRDYRMEEVQRLSAEIKSLEAKEDSVSAKIEELSDGITGLEADLAEAKRIRDAEHGESLVTIKKGKRGEEAVGEAIAVLKAFYSQAAKAGASLLQRSRSAAQASPVERDAGFDGAYQGKQAASEGIVGMLEVLKSDFQRTVKATEQAEADAHAEFEKFEQAGKSDIAGKTMKKERDSEDLVTTKQTQSSKMTDMKTNMGLVDSALTMLEELKPTCVDTGMSFSDRVAKREEEIKALKVAVCMLDADNVEPDCVAV